MQSIVVSYRGDDDPEDKVKSVIGDYKRTEASCFRKEGGGKMTYVGGMWYIYDRLGQQVAWVEGGVKTVPPQGWQTRGNSALDSAEDFPILAEEPAATATASTSQAAALFPRSSTKHENCWDAWNTCWEQLKEKLPHEHRQSVEIYEAKARDAHAEHWPTIKRKMSEHGDTAMRTVGEYAPTVAEKGKEGCAACHGFWTHPDTQESMKKGANAAAQGLMQCFAGVASFVASLMEDKDKDKKNESAAESNAEKTVK